MVALRSLARPLISWVQARFRSCPKLRHLMVETFEEFDSTVVVDGRGGKPILLHVTSRMENQRATGFFNKEPDTIAWLDQLQPGDLFLDVGANIGVYSLYAAVHRGASVVAFEPESQNFAALNRNIHRNGLAGAVVAFPLAASDEAGPTELHLSSFATGQSHHSAHAPVGEGGVVFRPVFVQGTLALTSDEAMARIAPDKTPRFVKIDVDGNEARVLGGMTALLANPKLEQVLVELSNGDPALIAMMEQAGFEVRRPDHTYGGRGNHIFVRKEAR